MSKSRVTYVCTNCGYQTLRWIGKCPECDSWNSFSEELLEKSGKRKPKKKGDAGSLKAQKIRNIEIDREERILANIGEFDRVLGGGLIPGSVVLIGGEPGIGKSTLVLQAAAKINADVLYITGEESIQQITIRAKRLNAVSETLLVAAETNLQEVLDLIDESKPAVVIIDSIQTINDSDLDNLPGSVTQIRECTNRILEDAKRKHYTAIIIGHVTKEGVIAGPKVLEHIVDTVLQFEGDSTHTYRIIRALKNRYGSTNEIGIFEMASDGLREVTNPSELFLSDHEKEISGSIVSASIEGTRALLIEVQSLVTPTIFGNPQRVSTGFDNRRLSMLLAVLEKRAGKKLSAFDVFLNITGGIRIFEPAIDLAVCCAVTSSLTDKPAEKGIVCIGEVGLGGEIRSVGQIEKRLQESEKLGFTGAIIPKSNMKNITKKNAITVTPVDTLKEAVDFLFANK